MTRPNGEGYEVLDDPPISLSPVSAQPPWHGQPEPVAVLIEMGRPASTAVQVVGACAYRDGVVLRFVVRIRETPRELRRRLFAQLEFTSGRGMLNMGLVPGGLRWGFEFSDGRCVTSLDEDPWVSMPPGVDPATWRPNSPVLMGLGKPTGWAGSWSRDLWPWPLPPAGPLRCVCLWPDRDIEETATTIDTEPIREAASRSRDSWLDAGAPWASPRGSTAQSPDSTDIILSIGLFDRWPGPGCPTRRKLRGAALMSVVCSCIVRGLSASVTGWRTRRPPRRSRGSP
jgi:hypothetical protein